MDIKEAYTKLSDELGRSHSQIYSDFTRNHKQILDRVINLEEKIDRIELQTTKTNGRVTALEEKVKKNIENLETIDEKILDGEKLVSGIKIASGAVGVLIVGFVSVAVYAYQHDIGTLKDQIDTLKTK